MTELIDNQDYSLATKYSSQSNTNYEINNFSKDLINKIYKTCGCILISELDIINNTLNEKHIQICTNHYQQTQSITNIISNELSKSNKNNPLYTRNRSGAVNVILINESYLNFGKYKNKTFNYVFQTDKLYCYNLAFWKTQNQHYKNININEFIKYIRNQISINEE